MIHLPDCVWCRVPRLCAICGLYLADEGELFRHSEEREHDWTILREHLLLLLMEDLLSDLWDYEGGKEYWQARCRGEKPPLPQLNTSP